MAGDKGGGTAKEAEASAAAAEPALPRGAEGDNGDEMDTDEVPPPPPAGPAAGCVGGASAAVVPSAPAIVSEAVASVAARAAELPPLAPCAAPSLGLLRLTIYELEERLRQAGVAWAACPPTVRTAWEGSLEAAIHPVECAVALRVLDAHLAPQSRSRAWGTERAGRWRNSILVAHTVAAVALHLIVLDDAGNTISANAEAEGWLRELWPLSMHERELDLSNLFDRRTMCHDVPTPLFALFSRARAVAAGRDTEPTRLRVRDRRGRWLVIHASAMAGPHTPAGSVAIVIKAAKSSEIAPIIIDAYSLTPRERDVVSALARGGSTAEIAAELFLSPHTIRDHIKTVFEKFGVSSRNELVARLYGEHYYEPLHDGMVHVG